MKLPPLSVLETWPTPNYIDPVTRGSAVLVVNIVMISLAFVVTCLRVYTRLKIAFSPGADDVLIMIAMGFAIGLCTTTSVAAQQVGFNRHIWDVPVTWLPTGLKLQLTSNILFSMASSFTKLSILWFCRRLLGASSKGRYKVYNWCYIGGIIFVAVSCVLFTLISIFQCNPVHAFWDIAPQYPHTCLESGTLVFVASIILVLTDFLVTILPMPLIWNLNLPTRQRIAVISIFGLGILVNVAGSCRTVYIYRSMIASFDATWWGWPVMLSAAVEIGIGLICASAPALRPLVASFLPRLLQSSRHYAHSYGRKTITQKLGLSTGASQNSHYLMDSRPDNDHFEVLRTVEMQTWTEAMKPGKHVNHVYDVTSEPSETISPGRPPGLREPEMVYFAPADIESSGAIIPIRQNMKSRVNKPLPDLPQEVQATISDTFWHSSAGRCIICHHARQDNGRQFANRR